MSRRSPLRLALAGLLLLILVSIGSAMAAANTVPESGLDDERRGIDLNADLKPAECAGITLDNATSGSGTIDDLAGNTLILGSGNFDNIRGQVADGDDCIVGGGSLDWIRGGAGDDVIIGGAGFDICFGDAGVDTFYQCEWTFP
ncbi:MAG TPA: hypothetical protein ENI95_03415 [Chloroflexi bacterium]|nr:hypothetical protein [Chloroflexota bacterium]